MTTSTLTGGWLILFGIMALVSTKVPDWIVPVAAIGVGAAVILISLNKKSNP